MADVGRSSIEDDFMYGSNVASCHIHIRMQFLRKVYGIVAAQLCLVALVSTIMVSLEGVKMFFQNNPGFLLLMFLATMVSLLAVYAKRLEHPTNLYLLALFTLFESFTIGTIVSFFDKILVIQAVILTAVIVVGLTVYTFQTKRDFSAMGAGLYACLLVLIAGGFLRIFIGGPIMELGLALGGALLFSLYLVYDTQQIMRKTSPEEYIDAAIQIYLDITRLFIEILRILEASRRN
ncbi:unnamed protein product [Adineta steineri]|uniref:Uncharacterized protein n=2 Tax=Adineta steineri TaxID=433720 RepID=A0A815ETR7_9BILA|nr:unnamed protein product [Adineta steineri]CAF1128837.1 unnamed protein product [Adineta steineri]CAF1310686.1 unnamed protein product [Adineta steineri]CAF3686020.1 unnamed protein product [Adineta steineri]